MPRKINNFVDARRYRRQTAGYRRWLLFHYSHKARRYSFCASPSATMQKPLTRAERFLLLCNQRRYHGCAVHDTGYVIG